MRQGRATSARADRVATGTHVPYPSCTMILPATPFALERHMLAPLAEGLPHLLRLADGRTVRILREPTMGLIIPDLLVGAWRPERPPRAYAATTWIDAHVRSLVEREGVVTPDAIRTRLYLSPNAAVASETRLVRHRLIVRVDPHGLDAIEGLGEADIVTTPAWMLTPGAETTGLEIVAVEAKLSRWQEAVSQAESYLAFADRAYVVLDGNRVRESSALLDAVAAARIGLVLQHGRVLRHVAAAPAQPVPRTPERVLAVTKLATERGGRAFRATKGANLQAAARRSSAACDLSVTTCVDASNVGEGPPLLEDAPPDRLM